MLFVYYQLHFRQKEMYALQPEGAGQPHVYGDDIEKVHILYDNIEQQQKFVAYASKYDKLKFAEIKILISNVKSKFDEIINGNKASIIPILDVSTNIFVGGDRTNDISYTKNEKYLYPIYSNGEKNGGLLAYSKFYTVEKDAVTISARGTIGYVEARKGKFTPVVRLITIIPNDKIKLLYLKYALKELEYERNGSGAGQLTVPEFKKMNIRYVNPTIQSKFVTYASKYDKLKFIIIIFIFSKR